MKILKVIPSRSWKHKISGDTVSIYGASPWTAEIDKPNWSVQTTGWTWQNDNGTVGLGRRPAKTEAEAIEVMDRFNKRFSKSTVLV